MRSVRIAILLVSGISASLFAADAQFEGKTLAEWQTQAQTGSEADRYLAVQNLGKAADKTAVPMLCTILLNKDESLNLRYESAASLALIASSSAAPSLLTALKDSDDNLRLWVVKALAVVGPGNADVSSALAEVQNSDSNAKVRTRAAAALKQIHEREAQIAQEQAAAQQQ